MTNGKRVLFFLCGIYAALAQDEEAVGKEWWRTAAVYQIYPLSFKDSDNDGRGDLKGITEKVSYLKETGVDAVWISPIYASPMADFGYDISNHTDIHEWYGTMQDFDQLSKAVHDSGMKLIMDFVPNHSSNQHEWFMNSENRVSGYEDYYVWKDPKGVDSNGKPIPPNNWVSIFYGSAWTYSEKRKQFYLHHFLKEQPDLNFRNPKVVEEMEKDKDFRDEPKAKWSGNDPMDPGYLDHTYTQHQPDTYALVQKWRELVDKEEAKDGKQRFVQDIWRTMTPTVVPETTLGVIGALMVEAYGEMYQVIRYFGDERKRGSHFAFNFQLIGLNNVSSARYVKRQINFWMGEVPEFGSSNWVVGNHDQHRVGTKIGSDLIDGINMLVTLLPGISITYYGEEIGMVNNDDITYEEGVDPQGCRYPKDQFKFRSRDFERTPFQWDGTTNAGFNKGKKPWLPVNKNYKELNLEAQKGKPYSHYTVYTDLMKLRKTPVVQNGGLLVQNVGRGTLGFVRMLDSSNFVVVLVNFSRKEDRVNLDSAFLIGSRKLKVYTTHIESGLKKGDAVDSTNIKLPGRSAVVLKT